MMNKKHLIVVLVDWKAIALVIIAATLLLHRLITTNDFQRWPHRWKSFLQRDINSKTYVISIISLAGGGSRWTCPSDIYPLQKSPIPGLPVVRNAA